MTTIAPDPTGPDVPDLSEVEERIGIEFSDKSVLQEAFVHRSYVNEVVGDVIPDDNERLEFLGDSIVGFIASDYLYRHYPDMNEGALTRLRSFLVRRSTLARLAGHLNLGAHLWLGRGEEESGGRERDATLCAVFESLVGAIFMDQGLDITTNFVLEQLDPEIVRLKGYSTSKDSKSRLQEFVQGNFNTTPRYKTKKSSGPDHARFFTQQVTVFRKAIGVGEGYRKQDAEQAAAAMALYRLGEFSPAYEPDEAFEARFDLAPTDALYRDNHRPTDTDQGDVADDVPDEVPDDTPEDNSDGSS